MHLIPSLFWYLDSVFHLDMLMDDMNMKEWKGKHMNDFLKMTMGFMEEVELPESKPRVSTFENYDRQDGI